MAEPRLTDLSKEVARTITEQFGNYFTCQHKSNIVYPINELSTLQVDCFPAGLLLERRTRAGLTRVMTLNISMQQRAPTQEVVDNLTNLADDVLSWLVLKRWLDGAVYSSDGAFVGTEVFDRLVKYKENVFQSIFEVNFQRII